MISIVDYGAGNIFSVKNALDYLGLENTLTCDPEMIIQSNGIILPGVGVFSTAMNMLKEKKLTDILIQQAKSKPFLGICLGMQLLFEKGYEFEETNGLALLPGTVEKMTPQKYSIPHIGWNQLNIVQDCPLLKDVENESYVYFVHSYAAKCNDKNMAAYCEYGQQVTALVQQGHIFGAQFHPEKSGAIGLKILKNFGDLL